MSKNDCLSSGELADFLKARLEPDLQRRVAEHLGGCWSCRERLVELKAASHRRTGRLPEPGPSDATSRRPLWPLAAALGTALLVAALIYLSACCTPHQVPGTSPSHPFLGARHLVELVLEATWMLG